MSMSRWLAAVLQGGKEETIQRHPRRLTTEEAKAWVGMKKLGGHIVLCGDAKAKDARKFVRGRERS